MATTKKPYAVGISSAGTHVYYAFETTENTKPDTSADWKEMPDVTATPELQESPEMLDYTPLSETTQHVATPGLRPLPSSADYTANCTDQFIEEWNNLCDTYDTNAEEGKGLWFCTVMPRMKYCFYQKVVPARLGGPGLEVDAIISLNGSITPASSVEWSTTKPAEE